MENKTYVKISELPKATQMKIEDYMLLIQDGTSKRIDMRIFIDDLKEHLPTSILPPDLDIQDGREIELRKSDSHIE